MLCYLQLRDIHERHLSIEKADNKRSSLVNEFKNFHKGIRSLEKKSFLNNLGLLFGAREKVLKSFKSRLFQINNLDKFKHANHHQKKQQNKQQKQHRK